MRFKVLPTASLTWLLTALLAPSAPAQAQSGKARNPATAALEVAKMGFPYGGVQVLKPGGAWVPAVEGEPLSAGDRVRTLAGGTARLEFPWTVVALGDGTEVSIVKNRVLTLQLDSGRIDVDPEEALLRIVTAEASISGTGRTLVRREGDTTFVGSHYGGANVEALGAIVRLGVNRGTTVRPDSVPAEARLLEPAPRVVSPASDPRYVQPEQDVQLTWTGLGSTYHLEILPIDSDIPVLSLDLDATEFTVRLPWLGTYRWRVSGRTGPVESEASGEGLICVVEK